MTVIVKYIDPTNNVEITKTMVTPKRVDNIKMWLRCAQRTINSNVSPKGALSVSADYKLMEVSLDRISWAVVCPRTQNKSTIVIHRRTSL